MGGNKQAPVTLGFLGKRIDRNKTKNAEEEEWFRVSKFGGEPTWHPAGPPKNYPLRCKKCGNNLIFICQLSTPYSTNVRRCLFVFGCRMGKKCDGHSGEWVAIRCSEYLKIANHKNEEEKKNKNEEEKKNKNEEEKKNKNEEEKKNKNEEEKKNKNEEEKKNKNEDEECDQQKLMGTFEAEEEEEKNKRKQFCEYYENDMKSPVDAGETEEKRECTENTQPQNDWMYQTFGEAYIHSHKNDAIQENDREKKENPIEKKQIKRKNKKKDDSEEKKENVTNSCNSDKRKGKEENEAEEKQEKQERKEEETFLNLPSFEIYVEEEFIDGSGSSNSCIDRRTEELLRNFNSKRASGQYDQEDVADAAAIQGEGGWCAEEYEEDSNKPTLKFLDIIRQNPKQVIRYSFNGRPLWLTGTEEKINIFFEETKSYFCEKCGSKRVFECQILSALIYQIYKLSGEDDAQLSNLLCNGFSADWGTILLYTCENDCENSEELRPYAFERAIPFPAI